jgi:hypothetical protein
VFGSSLNHGLQVLRTTKCLDDFCARDGGQSKSRSDSLTVCSR